MTPPKPTDFAVGDKITYTRTLSRGSGFDIATKTGTVIEIGSHRVLVRHGNKKTWMNPARVRKQGQPSELTEAFEAMANAITKTEKHASKTEKPASKTENPA